MEWNRSLAASACLPALWQLHFHCRICVELVSTCVDLYNVSNEGVILREKSPLTSNLIAEEVFTMAPRIRAIQAYRPRIDLDNTVQKPELVCQLARSTGLNEGSLDQAFKEARDWIIENLRSGRPVKIEGLGTWTPNIGLDGTSISSIAPIQLSRMA